jgi:hypothetical protein
MFSIKFKIILYKVKKTEDKKVNNLIPIFKKVFIFQPEMNKKIIISQIENSVKKVLLK